MNYSTFIVKIIKTPVQSFFKNNIALTELVVQLPQVRNKNCVDTCRLTVWGNLSYDVMKYYKINDSIIIEGYISVRNNSTQKNKQLEITVFKIYPFLLNDLQIEASLK